MSNSNTERKKYQKYIEGVLPYSEILPLKNYDNPSLRNRIVLCRNNKIFCTFLFSLEGNKLNEKITQERGERWNEMLCTFDKRFTFTFDYVRTKGKYIYKTPSEYGEAEGVKSVESKRKEFFSSSSIYTEELYLTVTYNYKNMESKNGVQSGKATLLTFDDIKEIERAINTIDSFTDTLGLSGSLLSGDDLYTYIYRSFSNDFMSNKKSVPVEDINTSLSKEVEMYPSTYPLYVVNDNGEGEYNTTLTFKELPHKTNINMFNFFFYLPFPTRVVIKYNTYSVLETQNYLYGKKKEFKSNLFSFGAVVNSATTGGGIDEDEIDYSSLSGKEECDTALQYMEAENVSGGVYTFTLILKDKDRETLDKEVSKTIKSALSDYLSLREEKRNNTFNYFTNVIFSSSSALNHNEFFLMTDNAVDTLIKKGTDENGRSSYLEKITGSTLPFVVCQRPNGSIFNFSPFGKEGEVGHTFMAGATGSGKSISLALFASEYLKYPKTRVIYIDYGLSCLNTVLSNHGTMFIPGVDKTTFSPFHNARDHIDSVISFVESIAIANGIKMTPEDRVSIKEVCMALPYGKENLETFYALLKDEMKDPTTGKDKELVITLYEYISTLGGGIFNATEDMFSSYDSHHKEERENTRIIGIELEPLLNGKSEALIYPTLTFLLNKIQEFFMPSEPCMVILDEAWKFLKDKFFSSFIETWLRTLRKKNAFVVIATQEIEDLTRSEIAHVILDSSSARIFLSNKRATEPRLYSAYTKDDNGNGLGLEDYQVDIISSLPPFTALVLQDGGSEAVSFCSSCCLEDLKTEDKMKNEYKKKAEKEKNDSIKSENMVKSLLNIRSTH